MAGVVVVYRFERDSLSALGFGRTGSVGTGQCERMQNQNQQVHADLQRRVLISEGLVGHATAEEMQLHLGRIIPGWNWYLGDRRSYEADYLLGEDEILDLAYLGTYPSKVSAVGLVVKDLIHVLTDEGQPLLPEPEPLLPERVDSFWDVCVAKALAAVRSRKEDLELVS